ncbi:hypothetical protein ZEAMMB73_Zm00001d045152 [Zea mays]|uniref:Uncharacterized protein n=1 Tax=Zea mays TaxID=4577 RepID=A0A1D6NU28_MAIZE|nr:hypothetical protein ZEAMMB73_Zm00001d045152 [Zea mays]
MSSKLLRLVAVEFSMMGCEAEMEELCHRSRQVEHRAMASLVPSLSYRLHHPFLHPRSHLEIACPRCNSFTLLTGHVQPYTVNLTPLHDIRHN